MTWQEKVNLLIAKGWRMEVLSEEMGASFFTIYRWSKGEHEPRRVHQLKIDALLKKEGIKENGIPSHS